MDTYAALRQTQSAVADLQERVQALEALVEDMRMDMFGPEPPEDEDLYFTPEGGEPEVVDLDDEGSREDHIRERGDLTDEEFERVLDEEGFSDGDR